ncbi:MAG: DUF4365 domain-containing protein [Anaerolineaceae bacterium]
MLPKYDDKNATGNFGVSCVQMIVASTKSTFQEIDTKNDLGIDAIIEIIKDQYPTHCRIAVQIKTGVSYYNAKKEECEIPVDSHAEYWTKYEMPVIGIVFMPEESCGYWVDIKRYLDANDNPSSIKFACSKVNRFDSDGFRDYFVPYCLGQVPDVPFGTAIELVKSDVGYDSRVGTAILFRRYPNKTETWQELTSFFRSKEINQIPKALILHLSYINKNPDLFTTGKGASQETKEYAQSLIDKFGKNEILKLMMFIDERGIDRGTLGQAVETIISSSRAFDQYLVEIILDKNLSLKVRESAGVIYAYKNQQLAIPLLEKVSKDSNLFVLVLKELKVQKGFYLY